MNDSSSITLLDCTIRDGTYAIDYKFTPADTRLMVAELERLGFDWIEVGHGVGLGGSEAGRGMMPGTDADMIRAAAEGRKKAMIGTFFIPGIGNFDHLKMAADLGLDFIRIGQNAPEIESAFPFITHARNLGMKPCLNFMKSYGITPAEFAESARQAVDAGVEIVYCVDSAGGMMPDDIAPYFEEATQTADCPLGFHGHNNLMMVVANCVRAVQSGASFLDVTLCGFGRSAGNAPTEIVLAVCEKMGIKTKHDLFAIMDLIDRYMWPLVSRTRAHDMMGVAAGYSMFHSSFLPTVRETARKHHAELRRLVAIVAQHDPVNLDNDFLEEQGRKLAGTATPEDSDILVSFDRNTLPTTRISNTMDSVKRLVSGLTVSTAKRPGSTSILALIPTEIESPDFLLSEFVVSNAYVNMGKITYGSMKQFIDIIEQTEMDISTFLVQGNDSWASKVIEAALQRVDANRIVPIDEFELQRAYYAQALRETALQCGDKSLLVYCPDTLQRRVLEEEQVFEATFVYGGQVPNLPGVVPLQSWEDWRHLGLTFDVIAFGAVPESADARFLCNCMKPSGVILSHLRSDLTELRTLSYNNIVPLDLNLSLTNAVTNHINIKIDWSRIEYQE